jgi:hypothetical protein
MSLLENLLSSGDGSVLKQLSGQFGLNGDQITSAVSTMVPALAGGLKDKLAAGGTGADTLNKLISGGVVNEFSRYSHITGQSCGSRNWKQFAEPGIWLEWYQHSCFFAQ